MIDSIRRMNEIVVLFAADNFYFHALELLLRAARSTH